jgi:hypothetical protein
MAFHRCAIQRCDDGSVVAADVMVNLEETAQGDAAGWYGTVSVTHMVSVVAGGRYRLVLDDGRSGEFTVRRNTFAGGADRAVAFHGVGPLR